jgi:hypothetical protein
MAWWSLLPSCHWQLPHGTNIRGPMSASRWDTDTDADTDADTDTDTDADTDTDTDDTIRMLHQRRVHTTRARKSPWGAKGESLAAPTMITVEWRASCTPGNIFNVCVSLPWQAAESTFPTEAFLHHVHAIVALKCGKETAGNVDDLCLVRDYHILSGHLTPKHFTPEKHFVQVLRCFKVATSGSVHSSKSPTRSPGPLLSAPVAAAADGGAEGM